MARIVILGAGISGHTVARYLGHWVGKEHQVTVVSPKPKWNWIPSNVWVGCGEMTAEQVTFDLAPIYKKAGVEFLQARALSIHPEGDAEHARPFVRIEYTDPARAGQTEDVDYDYLVNATGPKLNFGATPGLGPEGGHTVSVCTAEPCAGGQRAAAGVHPGDEEGRAAHASSSAPAMACAPARARPSSTSTTSIMPCARRACATRRDLIWISNEYELGDFGMGGVHITRGGYVTNGKVFAESLMVERGISWITRAAVNKIEPGKIHYETLDGTYHELDFDFAMLIPPFAGVGLKAFDKAGADITARGLRPQRLHEGGRGLHSPSPIEDWSKPTGRGPIRRRSTRTSSRSASPLRRRT